MLSLPPLRGEVRGYLVKAVARLRLPGSTPDPMWQDAQASRLWLYRILGFATSGPRNSVVWEMSRLPYSSVASSVARRIGSGVSVARPRASDAATMIAPITQ